jgi:hypothetical protein
MLAVGRLLYLRPQGWRPAAIPARGAWRPLTADGVWCVAGGESAKVSVGVGLRGPPPPGVSESRGQPRCAVQVDPPKLIFDTLSTKHTLSLYRVAYSSS